MNREMRHEFEDFYYLEAELLDERRLREWLDLTTEDLRYWMPIRHNPYERPANINDEIASPGEGFYFNDTKESLRIRIERLYAKSAWAEMPPSRTRRIISNVRLKKIDGLEFGVRSNFIVYRTRMEKDEDIFVGTREDILRRNNGTIRIAGRTIILDQAVLRAKNISIIL